MIEGFGLTEGLRGKVHVREGGREGLKESGRHNERVGKGEGPWGVTMGIENGS